MIVDLFSINAAGSRSAFLGDTTTDTNGNFALAVDAACYAIVFSAPEGRTFANGSQWHRIDKCFDAGDINNEINAVLGKQPSNLMPSPLSTPSGWGHLSLVEIPKNQTSNTGSFLR